MPNRAARSGDLACCCIHWLKLWSASALRSTVTQLVAARVLFHRSREGGTQDFMRLVLLSHGAPALRGYQEIQRTSCHSGTARRAGPGNYEDLLYQYVRRPVFMVSGLAGRARARNDIVCEFSDSLFRGGDAPGAGGLDYTPFREGGNSTAVRLDHSRENAHPPLGRHVQCSGIGRVDCYLDVLTDTEKQRRPRLGQVGAFASRLSFR